MCMIPQKCQLQCPKKFIVRYANCIVFCRQKRKFEFSYKKNFARLKYVFVILIYILTILAAYNESSFV